VGFPPRLALATKNPGKIREVLDICADWPIRWLLATDRAADAWPAIEETGRTYLDNALLKARAVASVAGVPAVADDSGIEVDALRAEPGPRSARFAGPTATDQDNLRLLIDRVRDVAPEDRTARYRCVAACAWPDGREVWAEGDCQGLLILEPRGSGGFGYDPIFVPEGEEHRTMAQLSAEEKNAISHRGRALRVLGDILDSTAG
jgi:XTP/dITP diphosphohydrolase